ncbi:MAG: hypothetical protein QF578_12725 [Alphaproteobacteria bacterium]|jgi:hypothetical protein|nr:hypothetical protein [Alphaproteobacteria bacterium]
MRCRSHIRAGLLLLLAALVSGCLGAGTADPSASEPQAERPAVRDQHRVYPAFYTDPPTCVVVLPGEAAAGVARAEQIEGALSRQLSGRIGRVIHPRERRRLARAMAVDLRHQADARHFAAATNCPALLRWSIRDAGSDYTPVWSEKRLSIETELIRATDGTTLWRASGTAARASGDVPLSILSLPFAAYKTARFQGDEDAVESMIDDLARRMVAKLPDVGG